MTLRLLYDAQIRPQHALQQFRVAEQDRVEAQDLGQGEGLGGGRKELVLLEQFQFGERHLATGGQNGLAETEAAAAAGNQGSQGKAVWMRRIYG
jgi:hypothetical protein